MLRRIIDILCKLFHIQRRRVGVERKEKPVKYPCRKCVYYEACGDGGRTKPCEDRRTKKDVKEADRVRY